jgi:uncharacterized protein (DUF2336 family)
MATITFDTLLFVKKLKEAGFTDKQAEAMAEAHKEAISQSLDTTLATKLDIAKLEAEIKVMKWMQGFILAGIATLIIKAFF